MFERLAIGIAFVGAASTQTLAMVPVAVPGPVIGRGLSGLVVAGIGIYAWYRNRK
jgi:hypothetical protein